MVRLLLSWQRLVWPLKRSLTGNECLSASIQKVLKGSLEVVGTIAVPLAGALGLVAVFTKVANKPLSAIDFRNERLVQLVW